jgi:spermidine/putrescine transport system permease protein
MSAGTATIAVPAVAERKQSGRWLTALLLAPSAVWFFVLLILPLAVVLIYSVGVRAPAGAIRRRSRSTTSTCRRAGPRSRTLTLAPLGTLICLPAGYPLALFPRSVERALAPDPC